MKQNNTLAWSNEFDEQNNCTKVYAHIINSNNESVLKVFIDEYSGYIDDDQSHDCFMAYIEKCNCFRVFSMMSKICTINSIQ